MPNNAHLLQAIKSATNQFESNDAQGLKVYEETIEGKKYRIFGVNSTQQSFEQVRSYRSEILRTMGLSEDMPALQVIGDSATFGATSEAKQLDPLDRVGFAREFLVDILDKHPNHALLYGLTGKSGDVNALVSDWIAAQPERQARVIGNAVSVHTPLAIESWGCSYGDIQNVTLVYPNAKFGADVNLTDQFVQQHNNSTGGSLGVCLEGGVQSFLQTINMLSADIPVLAVEKLRGPANGGCKLDGKYFSFFSAAEFLSLIKAENEKTRKENREITREEIEAIRNQYLHIEELHGKYNPELHKNLHIFANPSRHDYDTKMGLFTEAFNKFFEQQVWKKLDLLTIVDCEKSLKERAVMTNSQDSVAVVAARTGSPIHQQQLMRENENRPAPGSFYSKKK